MKQLQITQFMLCAVMFLALPAWGLDITEELPEGQDPVEAIKKEEPSPEEWTLTELPNELLAHILHYLPVIDLFSLRQVNRQMLALLADECFLGRVPEVPRSLDIGNAGDVLCYAANEGWLSILRLFIESKQAQINQRNACDYTALHYAGRNGQLAAVQYLVQQGAQVNQRNNDGDTALHVAVRHGQLAALQYLVGQGAEVNLQNNNGDTALHEAARHEHLAVLQYLVEQGTEVNLQNNYGYTALHEAAMNGQLVVALYLIVQRAQGNLQNNNADTDLHEAASSNLLRA